MALTRLRASQVKSLDKDDLASDDELLKAIDKVIGGATTAGDTLGKLEKRIDKVNGIFVDDLTTPDSLLGLSANQGVVLRQWLERVETGLFNQTHTQKVVPISSTAQIPFGQNLPLITEGTEISTINFKATRQNSQLMVQGNFPMDCSVSNRNVILALFKNNICIASTCQRLNGNGIPTIVGFNFIDSEFSSTFSTVAATYSIRVGINSNGTWYLNRMSTIKLNNSMNNNCIVYMEHL